jgi:hypothetical protein
MSYEVDYQCGCCEHEFTTRFTPSTPNRWMHGAMEDAEQGCGAEADPGECPECGCEVDVERLQEQHAED